jgi:glycogen synthase
LPYQSGTPNFRLQLLVVTAKAALEMRCQLRIFPSLYATNDWMTGLDPTYARHRLGTAFQETKFLHIFHNVGVG